MQKFIKKTFLFICPIALLFLILFSLLNKINKNDTDSFILNRNINKIVVGDSRVQYAIDDFVLNNTRNVAINSEGFMYSYAKIKYLTAYNPKIETIYLGAGYHSFSKYFDEYTFNEQVASRCFFYMCIYDQFKIVSEVESPLIFLAVNLKTKLKNEVI